MTTESAAPAPEENNNNRGNGTIRGVIIVVLLLALAGVGYVAYDQMQTNKALEETKAEIENERNAYIEELTVVGKQLEEKIRVIDSLGGDITELIEVKAQLETEKEEIRRSKNLQLRDLRDKVEGYEYLLREKDKEIAKLEEITQNLTTENNTLKSEKNVLTSELNNLNEAKEELEEKVSLASRLQAENISTKAVNSRGKEREGEFKPRHIDQLKIAFNIGKNDVAPLGSREILVRITDPQGNALFDVATGSGTFINKGKEVFYTAKKDILFDNSQQQIEFVYQKTKEFASGRYVVELFEGNEPIGKSYFIVK